MLIILATIPCLGLTDCGVVDATSLIYWIMSPSSGKSIIWRTIQDSNLKPIA